MQSRTLPLLIIALLCGLGAAYLAYVYGGGANRADPEVKVLVPVQDIKGMARLNNPAMFTEVAVRQSSLRSNDEPIKSFDDVKGCASKDFVLTKAKPFYKSDVVKWQESAIGSRLAEDEIAETVRVSPDDAGAGFITIGDRVDIICKVPSPRNEGNAKFKMVFQNIEVLGVNQQQNASADAVVQPPQSLTLRFKRTDSPVITMYRQMGTVNVVLRKPGFTEIVAVPDADVGATYTGTAVAEDNGMLPAPGKTAPEETPTKPAVTIAEPPPKPSVPTPAATVAEKPVVAIKPEPSEVDHTTKVIVNGNQAVHNFKVPNPKYKEDKDGKMDTQPKTDGSSK